jgi:hypothetical protein
MVPLAFAGQGGRVPMHANEELRQQTEFLLRQVREVLSKYVLFQMSDIDAALTKANANFLAAQGLVIATEFLGGLLEGTLGDETRGLSRARLIRGFRSLGDQYLQFGDDNLWALRNGLVHSYIPKLLGGFPLTIINDPASGIRLLIDNDSNKTWVNPPIWLRDLTEVFQTVIENLAEDENLFKRVLKSLSRIGKLE